MKNKILLISIITLLVGCQQKNEEFSKPTVSMENTDPMEGKRWMETQCYVCHSPTAGENEGRIAPPMIAVKARYLMDYPTKEAFTEAIVSFTEHPSTENALMKGAVKRFNVMPKQVFQKGSVEKIAQFMYDYQIDAPEWFKSHWKMNHGEDHWEQTGKTVTQVETIKTASEIGLEYALSTKKELGKNLMEAIQKNGTLAALKYCNAEAMPLTERMESMHNAVIKRVSDRNRNPQNKANAEELKHIEYYKQALQNGEELKPIVTENGSNVQFYYPIATNTMCLQCHGNKDQIKPEVLQNIKKLYPNDLAIGYGENEIRGIWSINFEKK